MDSGGSSLPAYRRVQNASPGPKQWFRGNSSNPMIKNSPAKFRKDRNMFRTRIVTIIPLVLHVIPAFALVVFLTYFLNGRPFYTERYPEVVLPDGTSFKMKGYRIIQSDITTLLSAFLMVVRWIAATWTFPLCWRIIILLAEKHGVRRRDIRWVTRRGVLPPATIARNALTLALGLVLIANTLQQAASPLLTGAIGWAPTNIYPGEEALVSSHLPTIDITGIRPGSKFNILGSKTLIDLPTLPTRINLNYLTAWGASNEPEVAKRVVTSAARLSVNSTVRDVILPYFTLTSVDWLQNAPNVFIELLNRTLSLAVLNTSDYELSGHLVQEGAILLTKDTQTNESSRMNPTTGSWLLALHANLTSHGIPCYETAGGLYPTSQWENCFAFARVKYIATSGISHICRVSSYSTLVNDTVLSPVQGDQVIVDAVNSMVELSSTLTPLANALRLFASPQIDPKLYIETFLTRLYSATWNSWTDIMKNEDSETNPITAEFQPAIPMSSAHIDFSRVYAWFFIQISLTMSGLLFLLLQSKSQYSLIEDANMIAFDMDSTEVPKPDFMRKSEPEELLRLNPEEYGWKAVVIR
ncbi:hypothetical protein B0J17DRAFT_724047 [Rhizoctonia solani]|nr:hypothetical protein B0J17DRAFT_726072 [Rhizoctonia solani]KAH7320367.1 hypothetical protein B0J17DRAFT_724047 [Rhizoctonia solani]